MPTFREGYAAVIGQLHVVSHAIGAGIFPGYHDAAVADHRNRVLEKAINQKRRVTYAEVVEAQIGAVLTDDFLTPKARASAEKIRLAFAPDAFIKLWGCNSGVRSWLYSDNGETDPAVNNPNVAFWWRALNLKNTPKPAVAQAFADYFQRKTYGATSGAHVEVLHKGAWVKSS